jgi:hypothetical protein
MLNLLYHKNAIYSTLFFQYVCNTAYITHMLVNPNNVRSLVTSWSQLTWLDAPPPPSRPPLLPPSRPPPPPPSRPPPPPPLSLFAPSQGKRRPILAQCCQLSPSFDGYLGHNIRLSLSNISFPNLMVSLIGSELEEKESKCLKKCSYFFVSFEDNPGKNFVRNFVTF